MLSAIYPYSNELPTPNHCCVIRLNRVNSVIVAADGYYLNYHYSCCTPCLRLNRVNIDWNVFSYALRPWPAQNRKLDQYIQPNAFIHWREQDHFPQATIEALKPVSITGNMFVHIMQHCIKWNVIQANCSLCGICIFKLYLSNCMRKHRERKLYNGLHLNVSVHQISILISQWFRVV